MGRGASAGGGPAWLAWVTRVSLVIGVVALVIAVSMVGPRTLLAHLATIGPWFGVLVVVELTISLLDAGVMYAMTRGRSAPSARQVIVAQLAGRAVNSVTPASTLGEALRVSLLGRECPPQRVLAGVLFAMIGAFVFGMFVVAAGTLATPLLFDLPPELAVLFYVAGTLAAAIAIAVIILVQRGMVSEIARVTRKLRMISEPRYEQWRDELANLDRQLRGDDNEHWTIAILLLGISQVLQRGVIWLTLVVAGYSLSLPQLVAILSAGTLLAWVTSIVPMGIGLSEGGNGALFALIGAPMSLGVALAFARRVNQIIFAVIGFSVLAADRLARIERDRAVIDGDPLPSAAAGVLTSKSKLS